MFLLALSVVIGSSCTPRLQQQTTLRIWQTAVDPKAVAVLKEIGAELERTHPGVRIEIESVAWGSLSSKLTAAVGAGDPPDIAHLEPFMAKEILRSVSTPCAAAEETTNINTAPTKAVSLNAIRFVSPS